MDYRASNYDLFPPVIKNFIIINVVMLLGTQLLSSRGIDLGNMLGMHYPPSELFKPWQIVTHIFMHGGWAHLLFNMYGLWMFGRMLEIVWGGKRFALFYFITAFAGALLYYLTIFIEVQGFSPELIAAVHDRGPEYIAHGSLGPVGPFAHLNMLYNIPTMGASGAVFGILGANYVLFGNTRVMIIFLPFSFKMKHLVLMFGAYELYRGIFATPGDNVAHFAHIGGLLAGILLVKYWNKTRRDSFY